MPTPLRSADGFLLGAETLRGKFPVETVKTVLSIAAEAEAVFNGISWAKALTERAGGKHTLFTHVESLAGSAVGCAERVAASLIIVFTQTGRAARLVAKYKPSTPILCVIVPRLCTDRLHWKFTGMAQARQSLIVRGLIPILADPKDSFASLHEGNIDRPVDGSMLASALSHAHHQGLISPGDRVVALQRLGGSAVVKILDVRLPPAFPPLSHTQNLHSWGRPPRAAPAVGFLCGSCWLCSL